MDKDALTTRLIELGISKKDFSDLANISYNTVNNWNNDTKPVPAWVEPFLYYYERAKRFDEVMGMLKKYGG
ncbi:hypothetical protein [Helicobacter sp. 11S02629-2]|uniref:hypothetical protein n=1 Tax=Helicobacter sp. 11S02629-2 TaxID=1476195 RepID=UPI000BA7E4A3|nr:hypothetical protein [Helicobacter sp. 11S02629-2]PAF44145.1 hypothetical protein BKH40_05995 [Helicobacter sp. 11S02629-2]